MEEMGKWISEHLVLCICLFAVAVCLIFLVVILSVKKPGKKKSVGEEFERLIACFGGIENILRVQSRESRLSLVLKDYDAVQEEELKKIGVSSSIRMSNKITFVVGSKAEKIEEYILSKKK